MVVGIVLSRSGSLRPSSPVTGDDRLSEIHDKSYGVRERISADTDIELAAESIRTLGYAIVDSGFSLETLAELSDSFERAREKFAACAGGASKLREVDEHNSIRAAFSFDEKLLDVARNKRILELVTALVGGYCILSQQNGIINPPNNQQYNQRFWHRDLPYQHVVLSRPLAINALFCLDSFTIENGATLVLPATHKQEAFPSVSFVKTNARQVCAPAGSFIVLDCMLYHSGSANQTNRERRAINHVYTTPMLRQQIDLPAILGDNYTQDASLRRLLGYEASTPRSVQDFLRSRISDK